jgi:hypothetical protein
VIRNFLRLPSCRNYSGLPTVGRDLTVYIEFQLHSQTSHDKFGSHQSEVLVLAKRRAYKSRIQFNRRVYILSLCNAFCHTYRRKGFLKISLPQQRHRLSGFLTFETGQRNSMSKTQRQNKAYRNSSCPIQAIQSSYPSQP